MGSSSFSTINDLREKRELALYDENRQHKYFHAILDYLDDNGIISLTFFQSVPYGGSNKIEIKREFRLIDVIIPTVCEEIKDRRIFALEAYAYMISLLKGKILSVLIDTSDKDCDGREYVEIFINAQSLNRLLILKRYAELCQNAKLSVL